MIGHTVFVVIFNFEMGVPGFYQVDRHQTGPLLERCTGAQCTVNFGDIRIKSLF